MINCLRKKEMVNLENLVINNKIYRIRQAMIYLIEKFVSAELMPEFTEAV